MEFFELFYPGQTPADVLDEESEAGPCTKAFLREMVEELVDCMQDRDNTDYKMEYGRTYKSIARAITNHIWAETHT